MKLINKIKNYIKYPYGNPMLATRKEHKRVNKWIKAMQKQQPLKLEL